MFDCHIPFIFCHLQVTLRLSRDTVSKYVRISCTVLIKIIFLQCRNVYDVISQSLTNRYLYFIVFIFFLDTYILPLKSILSFCSLSFLILIYICGN